MTMNKRVYGVIGIKSVMANWNADFTGYPKSISSGEIFGSDKALKYPMKKMWEAQGNKVLYIKSFKADADKKEGNKIIPRSLKERYELLFDVKNLKDEKDGLQVLRHLFEAIDVKNFGATFAEEKNNFSITGAVQFGQGFNKYKGTTVEEQQILSPFRDGKKEGAEQSTLGTKIVNNEAHYMYPFVINPKAYIDYVALDVTSGYEETDYKRFKEVATKSATAYNTNAKMGCENEFALFIEVIEDTYLPDLAQYIEFNKKDGENILTLGFGTLLKSLKERILGIEVYYNNYQLKLEGDLEGATYYNIFTEEEVSL